MATRLVIKTGEYTNKAGETKGEYTRLGVLMDGDGGQYAIIDPTINLAGCLMKQNMLNHKSGKQIRDAVMVSVFKDEARQDGSPQAPSHAGQPAQSVGAAEGLDMDIPF